MGTSRTDAELELLDGRILRTRISHPVNRSNYGQIPWRHILRDQLQVAEAGYECRDARVRTMTEWRGVMAAPETRRRATIRAKAQVTLPSEVREALHIGEGDEIEFTITDAGEVMLRGMTSIAADQRWFWEPAWQVGEREASEQIKAGDVEVFDDIDAMFNSLNQ